MPSIQLATELFPQKHSVNEQLAPGPDCRSINQGLCLLLLLWVSFSTGSYFQDFWGSVCVIWV